MIDHDRLFKELLTTFFFDFLELFQPEAAAYVERDSIAFLDKEVFTDVTSGEKHEADIVAQARFRDRDAFFLLHIENQSEARGGFPERMFRYFARLYEKHSLPVYPMAVFSYDQPTRTEPDTFRVTFPDFTPLEFHFRAVQLNRLDWHDFMNRSNPVASALMAKMQIAPEDRPKVKAECLRLLTTLSLDAARTQLISGFVDTYLRLDREEQKVFDQVVAEFAPPQKEQAMKIMTSWMEEGIEIGRLQGQTVIVLKQLRRRLGDLPEALEAQIRSLTTEQVESLAEALFDFTQPADLELWLNSQDE